MIATLCPMEYDCYEDILLSSKLTFIKAISLISAKHCDSMKLYS